MQLKASVRDLLGKRSRRLYGQGKLAAVVYGHNAKPTPLVLDRLEFQKVVVKSGRTHLVDLVIGGDKAEKVLVREIQTHPRRLGPIHVDFYQVNLEEKITVEVPGPLVGEPAAVKRGDADILQPIHSLRVECLPSDIPEAFEVDLTPLEEIESELRIADIKMPKGVTVLIDPEELVGKIIQKREMKVEEEVPAAEALVPAEGEAAAEGEAGEEEAAETKEGPHRRWRWIICFLSSRIRTSCISASAWSSCWPSSPCPGSSPTGWSRRFGGGTCARTWSRSAVASPPSF